MDADDGCAAVGAAVGEAADAIALSSAPLSLVASAAALVACLARILASFARFSDVKRVALGVVGGDAKASAPGRA